VNLLIAIKSCEFDRDRGAHSLIRETWGKDVVQGDLKFFTARPGRQLVTTADPDEVVVDAPDDYAGLPYKTREIVRYALANNYKHVFLCDTGSFVIPHHLVRCGFENFDYLGYWAMKLKTFAYIAQNPDRGCPAVQIPVCHPWASGGGYFLSRKPMELIAVSEPFVWAEDLWVGQVMGQYGIALEDRSRQGFKGFVVDWIHLEDNSKPDAMEFRRKWMKDRYERCQKICSSGGCASPLWDEYKITHDRIDPTDYSANLEERRARRKPVMIDPVEAERIIGERRKARRTAQ
jgi:hypothetical protein